MFIYHRVVSNRNPEKNWHVFEKGRSDVVFQSENLQCQSSSQQLDDDTMYPCKMKILQLQNTWRWLEIVYPDS